MPYIDALISHPSHPLPYRMPYGTVPLKSAVEWSGVGVLSSPPLFQICWTFSNHRFYGMKKPADRPSLVDESRQCRSWALSRVRNPPSLATSLWLHKRMELHAVGQSHEALLTAVGSPFGSPFSRPSHDSRCLPSKCPSSAHPSLHRKTPSDDPSRCCSA